MKVDAGLMGSLEEVSEKAPELEAQGFDGLVTAEMSSDPFFPLLLAAEHTERIELMTSIAVAFARSPMILANLANDLQAYSKGRFILGIGSQIAPHITKRFSMPWSRPAARMREFILAMRAVWDCWYRGEKLAFRGEFYTHTLMTPMFTPTNNPHGAPPVVLAAVGPRMTEVAGEVADGMLVHGFTTELSAGGDAPGRRERARQGGPLARRFPALLSGLRAHGARRTRVGAGPHRHHPPDRLLRVDAGLPWRAGAPRLGRAPDRAQRDVETR
jgi:probable F420-dependent oxidoreductase